jgi:acyl-CoA synthetase (AMP-forming)/AMP-acid ligase II
VSAAVRRTLLELLDAPDGRPRDPHGRAVVGERRTLTWGDLRTEAGALADRLVRAGAKPGTAVAVRAADGADMVVAVIGVWLAGGVFVPLNDRATEVEVRAVLEQLRPSVLVQDGRIAPLDDPTEHDPDVALITFTSGTTGPPAPVLQRHSGVLAMFEPVLATLLGERAAAAESRPDPMPNLIPVPLSLWAGLYNVLFAFRVGAPVVLMDRFETGRFAELIARFGIRSTVLPPAAMVMLTDDPHLHSLEPLRYVRSITAPLSPLQARRFRDRFGVTVLNGYGQTEFGGEIAGWSAADARAFGESHLGAAGRIHDGVEVQVRDEAGRVLAAGQEGELWVRTPAITAARRAGTAPADRMDADGWLRSGDIVRFDDQGFLWIEGRVSDVINRGGLKVHPGEVEEVLRLAPEVADVAVAGVPDERLGEVPWAFVVPADGQSSLDEEALRERCRAVLAPYKVPARVVTVTEVPRTPVGKVRRGELARGAAPPR